MTRYDLTIYCVYCACTSGDRKNSTLIVYRVARQISRRDHHAERVNRDGAIFVSAWVGRLHHPVTAIEIPKRARMGGLLCVCFGEPFALNCYQRTNRKRPVLLCSTSRKYAFVKSNQRTRHFVGGQ